MKKIIIGICVGFIIILIALFSIGKTEIKFNQDYNGNNYYKSNFYELYNSDKLIVINLWEPSCLTCIENLLKLDSLSKKFQNRNVQFVTFSDEKDTLKLKEVIVENDFLKTHDVTLENLHYRDSVYSNIDLIDYHVKNTFFKISSKKIPYIAVIKNKKVLFKSSDDEIDLEKLNKIIQDNSN